jgi:hypothetical protein
MAIESFSNMNLYSLISHREALDKMRKLKNETFITQIYIIGNETEELKNVTSYSSETLFDQLQSTVIHPVIGDIRDNESDVVAAIAVDFKWQNALENILPEAFGGIVAEVTNTCNQTYTYL